MISFKRATWFASAALLVLTASTFSVRAARAQEAPPAAPPADAAPARNRQPRNNQAQPSPVLAAFAAAKPTPEQDEKFKALTAQMTTDLRAMRGKNSTVEASERPAKVRAMQTKYQDDARALLTSDEQRKSFDAEIAKGARGGQNAGIMAQLDGLELSADQKTKVEPLIAEAQKQMMAIPPAERRTKNPEMLADLKAKMRPLLTPEQQTKLDAMTLRAPRAGRGAAGGKRPGGGGQGGNPAPPAP